MWHRKKTNALTVADMIVERAPNGKPIIKYDGMDYTLEVSSYAVSSLSMAISIVDPEGYTNMLTWNPSDSDDGVPFMPKFSAYISDKIAPHIKPILDMLGATPYLTIKGEPYMYDKGSVAYLLFLFDEGKLRFYDAEGLSAYFERYDNANKPIKIDALSSISEYISHLNF